MASRVPVPGLTIRESFLPFPSRSRPSGHEPQPGSVSVALFIMGFGLVSLGTGAKGQGKEPASGDPLGDSESIFIGNHVSVQI